MAPEVWSELTGEKGDGYSCNIDIFSLCATFYHVIKGEGPYAHNCSNQKELFKKKTDSSNYEPLGEADLRTKQGNLTEVEKFKLGSEVRTLVDILNYNLTCHKDKRNTAEELLDMFNPEKQNTNNFNPVVSSESIGNEDSQIVSRKLNPANQNS